MIAIILGIILVIYGIATIIAGTAHGANVGMDPDEYLAAMQLFSSNIMMGMGLLTGGMLLLILGIIFTIYGGFTGILDKFSSSRIGNEDDGNVNNPYRKRKKSPSKEKLTCQYCKANIQDGLKVCPECGTEFSK